jgi:hypothetical protein
MKIFILNQIILNFLSTRLDIKNKEERRKKSMFLHAQGQVEPQPKKNSML